MSFLAGYLLGRRQERGFEPFPMRPWHLAIVFGSGVVLLAAGVALVALGQDTSSFVVGLVVIGLGALGFVAASVHTVRFVKGRRAGWPAPMWGRPNRR